MTKADLVERVTAQISRTAGPMISKKDCARVVDAFLEAVKESLQHQENIEVRGFGTFKIRRRKTRMARNPRTGSPSKFPPARSGLQALEGARALVAGVDVSDSTTPSFPAPTRHQAVDHDGHCPILRVVRRTIGKSEHVPRLATDRPWRIL